MRRAAVFLAYLATLAVVAALLLAPVFVATGCGGDQTRRAVHGTVVSMGAAVSAMHRAHQAAYEDATNALRARLREAGATIEDYDREVAPVNDAFRARSQALQLVTAAVYTAAAANDATRAGADPAAYRDAARALLDALTRGLAVLRDGRFLAAVTIPPEVDAALAALRTLAGGSP